MRTLPQVCFALELKSPDGDQEDQQRHAEQDGDLHNYVTHASAFDHLAAVRFQSMRLRGQAREIPLGDGRPMTDVGESVRIDS